VNGVAYTHASGPVPPSRDELEERFERAGLAPRWWSDPAGNTYPWHAHSYDKILYCSAGNITFRFRDGEVALGPGDRVEIGASIEHAATVGERGVTCVEAGVEPGDHDH